MDVNPLIADMARFVLPVLAAVAGALLGVFVQGRPPPRHARDRPLHDPAQGDPDDGTGSWLEPQPEPDEDGPHGWRAGDGQNLGSGQWGGYWPWTSESTWSHQNYDGDGRPWTGAGTWSQPHHHDNNGGDFGSGQWHDGWRWQSQSWHWPRQPWSGGSGYDRDASTEWTNIGRGGDVHHARRREEWRENPSSTRAEHREQVPAQRDRRPRGEERDDAFLHVPGWGRGAPLRPLEHRAPGFWKNGVWVNRPRNDFEERLQRGGGGEQRTERREGRVRAWEDGSFRPASFWRAMREGVRPPTEEERAKWGALLSAHLGPSSTSSSSSAPLRQDGVEHQVRSRTQGSTWSSPWWTSEEWQR